MVGPSQKISFWALKKWKLFFHERWIKSFCHATIWSILYKMWSTILEKKWSGAILEQTFGRFFTKKIIYALGK